MSLTLLETQGGPEGTGRRMGRQLLWRTLGSAHPPVWRTNIHNKEKLNLILYR
jgi:hypothetical protein